MCVWSIFSLNNINYKTDTHIRDHTPSLTLIHDNLYRRPYGCNVKPREVVKKLYFNFWERYRSSAKNFLRVMQLYVNVAAHVSSASLCLACFSWFWGQTDSKDGPNTSQTRNNVKHRVQDGTFLVIREGGLTKVSPSSHHCSQFGRESLHFKTFTRPLTFLPSVRFSPQCCLFKTSETATSHYPIILHNIIKLCLLFSWLPPPPHPPTAEITNPAFSSLPLKSFRAWSILSISPTVHHFISAGKGPTKYYPVAGTGSTQGTAFHGPFKSTAAIWCYFFIPSRCLRSLLFNSKINSRKALSLCAWEDAQQTVCVLLFQLLLIKEMSLTRLWFTSYSW